jgi:DNA repair protein SbcC/Rad50
MKLRELTLKNFKKHRNLTVQFDDTLTVIRGANWAGKSTVLKAVLFALFGASAVPGKRDGLTTRGESGMEVRLTLGTGEVITRTVSTCTVTLDGKVIASGHTPCNEWVSKSLGLSSADALALCHSPQSQTAALLSLGTAKINRLVEQISGADEVEVLALKCAGKIKALEIQQVPVPDLSEVSDKVSEAESTEAQALLLLTQAQEVLSQAKEQHQDSFDAWQAAVQHNAAVAKAQSYVKQCEQFSEQSIELEDEAAKLLATAEEIPADADVPLREEHERLSRQAAEHAHLIRWFSTVGQTWVEGEKLRPEVEKLTGAVASAEQEVVATRTAVQEAQANYTVARAEWQGLEKARTDAICSTCKRPFDAEHAEKNATLLKDALVRRDSAKVKLEQEEKVLAAALEAHTTVSKRLQALKASLPPEGYEQTFAEMTAKLEATPEVSRETLDDLARRVSEAGAKTLHKKFCEDQAREAREKAVKLREKVAALLPHIEGHDLPFEDEVELKAEQDDCARLVSESQAACQELFGQHAKAKADAEHARAEFSAAAKLHDEQKDIAARLARWESFQKWLRSNKNRLLGDLWDSLTAYTSDFITQATEGAATGLVRGADGGFSVIEDGESVPADGGISGGMAAIAGTALKLSLGSCLPVSPGFILLDEPSSELDNDRAAALASALSTAGVQVILVTHRTGEEYVAGTVVTLE